MIEVFGQAYIVINIRLMIYGLLRPIMSPHFRNKL